MQPNDQMPPQPPTPRAPQAPTPPPIAPINPAIVITAPAPLAYVPATRNEVIKVIVLGLLAGLAVPLLAQLVANYAIDPIFCRTGVNTFNICASGGVVANHVAAIIVAMVGFLILTRWAVYRALLLVVAVTIAMWGLKKYADPLTSGPWLEYYLFFALLHGLAFALFYWLLRLRNFIMSLILTILAVIAACVAVVM